MTMKPRMCVSMMATMPGLKDQIRWRIRSAKPPIRTLETLTTTDAALSALSVVSVLGEKHLDLLLHLSWGLPAQGQTFLSLLCQLPLDLGQLYQTLAAFRRGVDPSSNSFELLREQRDCMKYLVEGVTHWLRYAPSKVMAFVQKVATDMLEPDPERSKSCILQLLIGLARYGTRHIRRCMARSVLPLLQSDSREVGLSLLVSCRYDLGRFGTDIVSALCHCVKDTKDPGAFSQLEMILRHSPSPGKIYPQAWVFLNCFIRRAPRSLKPKVRHLWLRLSSTWSRRDSPEDDYEYYPRGPFWLLTYPAEAQRIIRERRRNCTRCPKKYCCICPY
ncbi:unnamed protein product [Cladocopium goreaui]|uniref:Uncharacterized protein n=1 Tax=Cladocopium goreaui TaxID=2562237 RepID=A0A9P1G8D9_9DINO|nr:unnamed protein product [Cladocopium goreaui]